MSLLILSFIKEPSPIFLTFFQTCGDFAITRNIIFSHKPMANLTAVKSSFWKILIRVRLVMGTIIKLTQ